MPIHSKITVNGPFWTAEDVDILRLTQPSGLQLLLNEDFQRYDAGADPDNWRDTTTDNMQDEDQSLFKTQLVDGRMAMTTVSEQGNIHSHFEVDGVLDWTNYRFTGRMRIDNSDAGIGITFFSRYPDREDAYYRLRRHGGKPNFRLDVHPDPEPIPGEPDTEPDSTIFDSDDGDPDNYLTDLVPAVDTWYSFRIDVVDDGSRTNIRIKIWDDAQDEPADYLIDVYDQRPERLTSGTVGLWSLGTGTKAFDNFEIRATTYTAQRTLFVDKPDSMGQDTVLQLGTVTALCAVPRVRVQPADSEEYVWERSTRDPANQTLDTDAIRTGISDGRFSLLLLQAEPSSGQNDAPSFICLNGYINLGSFDTEPANLDDLYTNLDLVRADQAARDRLAEREGATRLPGESSVHSSGMSIYGSVTLPWESSPIPLPFQLAKTVADGNRETGYRLTIEVERLTLDETEMVISSWKAFSSALNPAFPMNGIANPGETPNWVTLEIPNPLSVPRIFWQITDWGSVPPTSFERGEFKLLVSDLPPYDSEHPPSSVARVVPDNVAILPDAAGNIDVAISAGTGSLVDDIVAQLDAGVIATDLASKFADAGIELRLDTATAELADDAAPPAVVTVTSQGSGWQVAQDDRLWEIAGQFRIVEASDAPQKLQTLTISENADVLFDITDTNLNYFYTSTQSSAGGEHIELESSAALELAFDPVETPRDLRNQQGLPEPDWSTEEPVDPALIWGFMPLEDGWAQLPMPNLTEQMYLDSGLALEEIPGEQAGQSLVQGAVQFGNDDPDVKSRYPAEQPWSLSLVNARSITGTWSLSAEGDDAFRLQSVAVTFSAPDLVVNGLLWFSTGTPTPQNALPETTNWISGMRTVSLRSRRPDRDLFPPALTCNIDRIGFSVRLAENDDAGPPVDPALGEWAYRFVGVTGTLNSMYNANLLPENVFGSLLPLVWQRHLYLPMVQSLPMTQSQSPPNYPEGGRQYMPFELRTTEGLPDGWHFGVARENGAACWPRLLQEAAPAQEWRTLADLTLASLSIPGLSLNAAAPIQPDSGSGSTLPAQLRFDLPYTDELNALAQLPKIPRDPEAVSPLPDSPVPQPPAPLSRATFAEHWQRLAERANLSMADAVAMFETAIYVVDQITLNAVSELVTGDPNEQTISNAYESLLGTAFPDADALHQELEALLGDLYTTDYRRITASSALRYDCSTLIEPLRWQVRAILNSNSYPGAISLSDVNGSDITSSSLSGDSALKGVSGTFVDAGTDAIARVPDPDDANGTSDSAEETNGTAPDASENTDNPNTYAVEAGSMSARKADGAGYRDQRGLNRHNSQADSGIIRTKLELAGNGGPVDLASMIQTTSLFVSSDVLDGSEWAFWFRDVPVRTDASGAGAFVREDILSPRVEDVNDPEANSREHDYLQGYEWRLGDGQATDEPRVDLFGLHFYPLTLERIELDGAGISRVEIVGRLQLPLSGSRELEAFSNAARLTFQTETDAATGTDLLKLSKVERVGSDEQAEWPLALESGLNSDAPHLFWTGIELSAEADQLIFTGVHLDFVLFDERWTVALPDLVLFEGGWAVYMPDVEPVQSDRLLFAFARAGQISPAQLTLELDMDSGEHVVDMIFDVRLGPDLDAASRFTAQVCFHLLGENAGQIEWLAGRLFSDLEITMPAEGADADVVFTEMALQFAWRQYELNAAAGNMKLLPGMHLSDDSEAPGFATLTFALTSPGQVVLQAYEATSVPADASLSAEAVLTLETAFVETLIGAVWGKLLQDETEDAVSSAVFGSSAGNLTCGFSAQESADSAWQENFLINGVLEVKNLVSWPTGLNYDDATGRMTLPASRSLDAGGQPVDPQPALSHARHTICILLNQHQIPDGLLEEAAQTDVLFNLKQAGNSDDAADNTWQFLAVVEHQVVDVTIGPGTPAADATYAPPVVESTGLDRRWTALQEVRLLRPGTFAGFLNGFEGVQTSDPFGNQLPVGAANQGYLSDALRADLAAAAQKLPDTGSLIVEASAPHFIRQDALASASPTTLQFLPGGSQTGVLSSPDDFGPSAPEEPQWLLVNMPFLGRLQDRASDLLETTEPVPADVSLLQVDPVLRADSDRAADAMAPLDPTLLGLVSRSDRDAAEIPVAHFDLGVGRQFHRLDPASLEENWFRLQNPLEEPVSTTLQSVTAALPDTPARLSRSTALRAAFVAFRPNYPPAPSGNEALRPLDLTGDVVWRDDSLLQSGGHSDPDKDAGLVNGWHLTALLISQSPMTTATGTDSQLHRFPAATLLPHSQNDMGGGPLLTLSVSPYVGLAYRSAASSLSLRLASAELLCLDRSNNRLLPAASQLWEFEGSRDEASKRQELALSTSNWAVETHRRIAPESPLAVLRFREIHAAIGADGNIDAAAPLVTRYRFSLVRNLRFADELSARVFRLRSDIVGLRFREGQYGGHSLPADLKQFEVAAPQVTGLQPLYLPEQPGAANNWPWGLSALRVSVTNTGNGEGALSYAGVPENGASDALRLWWQAPQHRVQFRSTLNSDLPAAGLPPVFRGRAIRSLLPILPDPPMPALDANGLNDVSGEKVHAWQPALPGKTRYLLTGNRSGVHLALRHHLVTQVQPAGSEDPGFWMNSVSGSVPVQHRMPRPVQLPANTHPDKAKHLQTWASFFEPDENVLAASSPVDEAWFAACSGRPARRLRISLADPAAGQVPKDWDGVLQFDFHSESEAAGEQLDWDISMTMLLDDREYVLEVEKVSELTGGTPVGAVADVAEADFETFEAAIGARQAGETLTVLVTVAPAGATDGFAQTLRFPLTVVDAELPVLPLQPTFIHFEDPEYNRQLASASAHAAILVQENRETGTSGVFTEPVVRTVTIAADRKAYNPDSDIAVRYDWDRDAEDADSAVLELWRLGSSGAEERLDLADDDVQLNSLAPGSLQQFSLLNLLDTSSSPAPKRLKPGDKLQLRLRTLVRVNGENTEAVAVLSLEIVAEPVVPVPAAAFGLLRRQVMESEVQVECTRFAWGPLATRIELVCPEDLRQQVVRRRAVFQWLDTFRPETQPQYAIQKIAPNGSTHFPEFS